jgi:protein-tyrosine phosphatase
VSASVLFVSLDRDDDGQAVVGWAIDGDSETVEVAWGTRPEPDHHTQTLVVPAAAGTTSIGGLPAGPVFVSVSPSDGGTTRVAGMRNLDLVGPTNFRDLGGYRNSTGATVRWGRIFRSDALIIPEEGYERFGALGIRTIFDLRSTMEVDSTPDQLPPGDYDARHLPLVGEDAIRPDIMGVLDGEEFLSTLYAHILERSPQVFGTVIKAMADESNLPLVFHCAAGKDRAGLMAAVVLLALGVDEETILDDYELTSQYRTSEQITSAAERMKEASLVAAEAVAGLLRTPRWTMEKSLSFLKENYGSVEEYLTGPAGVTRVELGRLRSLMLSD